MVGDRQGLEEWVKTRYRSTQSGLLYLKVIVGEEFIFTVYIEKIAITFYK
jgi:hypothetical protein